MLNERYGPEIDHLRVMWVGRDERLAISVEEMSEFYRDYVCWPDATGAGDWIDSQYAQHRGITRENAQGAVAIVICFPRQLPGSRRLRLLAWLRPLRWLGALFTRVVSRFLFRRVILRGAANRVGRTFLSPMNYREGGRVVDHLLATARATREPRVRIDILNGVIDPPALRTAMLEEAVTPLRAMLEDEVESWDRAIGGVSVSSACMTIDFELDKIHHEPLIPGDLPVYRCVVEIVDKRGKLHRTQVREFWRS